MAAGWRDDSIRNLRLFPRSYTEGHSSFWSPMSNRRKLLWALVVVLALVTMVWIGTPNLLRSRIAANEASIVGKLRSMDNYVGQQDLLRNGPPGLVLQAAAADKKLIR